MATHYVYSGGNDTTGADWTNAWISLTSYVANGTPGTGDVVYIASDHVAGYTGTVLVGTLPANVAIISVDRTTGNRTAGANERTSGTNLDWEASFAGSAYVYGVEFGQTATDTAFYIKLNAVSGALMSFEACEFYFGGGSSVNMRLYDGNAYHVRWDFTNCAFTDYYSGGYTFNANQRDCKITLFNCVFNNPNFTSGDCELFYGQVGGAINIEIINSDISTYTAITDDKADSHMCLLRNCKVNSSLALATDGYQPSNILTMIDCSTGTISSTLSQLTKSISYFGTVETDTATSRNATDGEESYSWKFTPNSYATIYTPLECPVPIAAWHDASGSKTLTIYLGSNDSGLLDNEVYAYVTHVDENGTTSPVGEFISSRGDGAAAGTSTYLKTDSSTWGEGTVANKYKLEFTGINPAEPGFVYVRLFFAYTGASNVLWVDPAITLT